jgi:autoinducer 2-degrading protein
MYIVHVFVHVKPEAIEAFKSASSENASHSLREPGVARFDLLQESEDPTRFVLLEVYRDKQAAASHKETAHYARWRDAVETLMQEPRSRILYQNIQPADEGWG